MQRGNGTTRYAIEFQDVSRKFVLHHEHRSSFQDWFIGLIRTRGTAEEFWALRDVTFGIRHGETLGLIGRNGAGKSTLLKLVTRILGPSTGNVQVNGRTYAMLELGAGFHPELSGRDNIYLNGSLYGFSRKEMAKSYDEIVAFAELERFIDTPVKHYSSGMFARLGFGIAVNMRPEILVIDEVLAVGDAQFQEKCFRALAELKARGTTILFVSHDAPTVRSFCDRAALLVDGQLVDIGAADDVVDHYEQIMSDGQARSSLLRVRVLDQTGIPIDTVQAGDPMMVEVLIRTPPEQSTAGLDLRLDLDRIGGANLWSTQATLPANLPFARQASQRNGDEPDTRVARLSIDELPLSNGQLRLMATLSDNGGGDHGQAPLLDRQETLIDIQPASPHQRGILALNHSWAWEQPNPEPFSDSLHHERQNVRR